LRREWHVGAPKREKNLKLINPSKKNEEREKKEGGKKKCLAFGNGYQTQNNERKEKKKKKVSRCRPEKVGEKGIRGMTQNIDRLVS